MTAAHLRGAEAAPTDGDPVIVLNEPGTWPDGIRRGEWLFRPEPHLRPGSRFSAFRAVGPGVELAVDETPHAWAWAVYLAPGGKEWARGVRTTREAAANAAAYSADRRAHHLAIGRPDPMRARPTSPQAGHGMTAEEYGA